MVEDIAKKTRNYEKKKNITKNSRKKKEIDSKTTLIK